MTCLQPIISGDAIFFGSGDGYVYAVTLEVETELGGIFSSPAFSSGYLVFSSTEGAVYCLKAGDQD